MATASTNAYLRTKVLTASPAELRLMLLDGAIRFLEQGKAGLERKDYEAAFEGVSRCQSILMELINAMRPEQAPDLCSKLSGLYTFMYTRLADALSERKPEFAAEILELLRYERQTWAMVMERLADENRSSADSANDVAEAASDVTGAARSGKPNDLVGGRLSVAG